MKKTTNTMTPKEDKGNKDYAKPTQANLINTLTKTNNYINNGNKLSIQQKLNNESYQQKLIKNFSNISNKFEAFFEENEKGSKIKWYYDSKTQEFSFQIISNKQRVWELIFKKKRRQLLLLHRLITPNSPIKGSQLLAISEKIFKILKTKKNFNVNNIKLDTSQLSVLNRAIKNNFKVNPKDQKTYENLNKFQTITIKKKYWDKTSLENLLTKKPQLHQKTLSERRLTNLIKRWKILRISLSKKLTN